MCHFGPTNSSGHNGVFSFSLRGVSLTSNVNDILSVLDNYSLERFISAIQKVLPSNQLIMIDDTLVLTVSTAQCRNGGGRKKVVDTSYDQVISKNKINLFCPVFRHLSSTLPLGAGWFNLVRETRCRHTGRSNGFKT